VASLWNNLLAVLALSFPLSVSAQEPVEQKKALVETKSKLTDEEREIARLTVACIRASGRWD